MHLKIALQAVFCLKMARGKWCYRFAPQVVICYKAGAQSGSGLLHGRINAFFPPAEWLDQVVAAIKQVPVQVPAVR